MVKNNKLFRFFSRKLHYYKAKGYFSFIGFNVLRIAFLYALVILGFVLLGKFLLDLDGIYKGAIDQFKDFEVLLIFFVSESLLGMIPPDLFMLWTGKFKNPFWILTLLGVLSYLGGIISYRIGTWIAGLPRIKKFIEKRLQKYITLTRKWGGAFITISALFPFSPYATVVLAVSLLKYPNRLFLIFGLSRILRFMIQGILMVELINLNF
ncbi:MAG: short-chain dehydrogenase [Bacteroidetes bacterium]|nr:MAG: short-chain dehydrogenase [Bacteroidota bacterium]